MKSAVFASLLLLLSPSAQALQHHLLIVSGIGGTDEYSGLFAARATSLYQAAIDAGLQRDRILLLSAQPLPELPGVRREADKTVLLQAVGEIGARADPGDRIFVILIGHGNSRGDGAVFNLPGPDISAAELGAAFEEFGQQTLIIVNTASASGPFIGALSADNRIVITATSSALEYHATQFGEFFVAALATTGADRDKDERISMLEAFDYARREVRRAYESEKRLLTEHALLDDNGDAEGSLDPGEYEPDGALANRIHLKPPWSLAAGASAEAIALLQRKLDLEQAISELKRRRDSLPAQGYYDQLELLLVDLALLGREIRRLE
jgi:hypothetical protein